MPPKQLVCYFTALHKREVRPIPSSFRYTGRQIQGELHSERPTTVTLQIHPAVDYQQPTIRACIKASMFPQGCREISYYWKIEWRYFDFISKHLLFDSFHIKYSFLTLKEKQIQNDANEIFHQTYIKRNVFLSNCKR